MLPVSGGLASDEGVVERLAHGDDAAGHDAEGLTPLLEQLGILEHSSDDERSVLGRVGEGGADEQVQLRVHRSGSLGIIDEDVEGTSAFTVESKVLGKGLSNEELEALSGEIANSLSVLIEITTGEALVGTVEEGEELLGADDRGDLLPLIHRGVNSSRVVSAGMQKDDRSLRGVAEILKQAGQIETEGGRVPVAVFLDFYATSSEDGLVVT